MQDLAMAWFILEQSGSGTYVGMILAVEYLAMLACTPFAGTLVDRLPKRTVVVVTRLLLMSVAVALAVTSTLDWGVGPVFVLATLRGVMQAVNNPASIAFVSDLVPNEDMRSAVMLSGLLFNVGRIIGALFGSIVLSLSAPTVCFGVNAMFLFLSAITVSRIPRTRVLDSAERVGEYGFRAGVRYIVGDRLLRTCLIVMALASTFSHGVAVYMALLARDFFGGDVHAFAMLLTLFSVGFIVCVLFSKAESNPSSASLLSSVTYLGMALLLLAVAARFPLAGMLATFTWGVTNCMFATRLHTIVQINSAAHRKGRVIAAWSAVSLSLLPVGATLVGYIGEHLDVRIALIVASLACFAAAAFGRAALEGDNRASAV